MYGSFIKGWLLNTENKKKNKQKKTKEIGVNKENHKSLRIPLNNGDSEYGLG